MTHNVDFDALARRTKETNGAMEALDNLFGAAFALKEWHFIARGELPNLNPYIASNADYADGQQMIRAFTDAERLQRFAKENNLTAPDGMALFFSIPTEKIIDYLEQFIPYGVHGIWFNSDTESDGFFIPLKQLRAVKAHLAELNRQAPSAPSPERETLIVIVKDGLMFPSGFTSEASYICNFFCRVPADWTEGEKLKTEYLERIYQQVYGINWRMGNDDGSHYVVLDSYSQIFDSETVRNTNWADTVNDDENHFWFYIVSDAGEIKNVSAKEFQSDVDASFQTAAPTTTGQIRQSDSQATGSPLSPDGETPLNVSINRRGAINFDTPIATFYQAIVPLLANYKGSGEFVTLMAFDPGGISELVEDIAKNSHGNYLRVRRFLYLNPKNNVRIGVNSIHSNYLHHFQTNAELIISFELCRNLDNQTAALYYRFEGPENEVLKLSAAIQPALDEWGFSAAQ